VLVALLLVANLSRSDGLPVLPPAVVGMSAARLAAIDRVVTRGMAAGGYPGAAVVIGRRGAAVYQKGFGRLDWLASSPRVRPDRTIYDLASLTKVVGTTTAAMILFDEGRLDLDAPVGRYLPEFSGGLKEIVTVRMLLTHQSGLPPGRDLWRLAKTPGEAKALVLATPLAYKPGSKVLYSDLGADVLGWVVEAIAGQGLDRFLDERVFAPLGMNDTYFRPPEALRGRIAPTEVSPPRGYPLRGEVHDENAWALGGVAGHAGLFSTAADLSIFAQMMLNRGEYGGVRIVSDSVVDLFTRRVAGAGTRALGWDTSDGAGSAGLFLGERAYGHTGYTGTSLWIDPERELFVILLTNRVHAPRARRPARVIADVRADVADLAALAVTDADVVLRMPSALRSDRAVGWRPPVRRATAAPRQPVKRATAGAKTAAGKPAGRAPTATARR
jgi:CubicO group peptidase (beta-lactamase class C family)